MKATIITILLALFIFSSCKKNEVPTCKNCNFDCLEANEHDVITNNCLANWECDFVVVPDSKVDVEEYLGFTSGAKNVFQMLKSTQGEEFIADDEFTDILVFELDDSQKSFSADNNELEKMNVHFKRVCFCSEVLFLPITTGCLQGEKQSNGSWFVQGKLTIPFSYGSEVVKLDAEFN